mgnify:CR=1 FL=1
MTRPHRFLVRMLVFLAAVLVVVVVLFPMLEQAVMANVPLNALILAVLLLGIGFNIRQVMRLAPEVRWVNSVRYDTASAVSDVEPRLLAPVATMLGERRGRLSLSAMGMRSILDGIASRLDESRDISRYFVGLLIFLGLLGTFWGLLQTVGSISEVIKNLSLGTDDMQIVFDELKSGLEKPLDGMGTAFSSSLLGLAGSLVLGFLDLQTGQAQNRFYNDLEDWLSAFTKMSGGGGGAATEGGDQPVPAYVQALLEQTAESLESLQTILQRGEESRQATETRIQELTERLSALSDQMDRGQQIMVQLAESQAELKPVLGRLAESREGGAIDETTQNHIRNIDVHLDQLAHDVSSGREDAVRQIRNEIKVLARTIAALAEDEQNR